MNPNQNPNQQPKNTPRQPTSSVQPHLPEPEPSLVNIGDIPSNSMQDGLRPPPKNSRAFNSFKGFFSVIELVAGALLLAFAINTFIFQSYQVFGQSMEPTLQQDNRLIISKLGKSWADIFNGQFVPDRGQIIVFVNPRNPDIQLVKRVIGLPGERVLVKDGSITVFNEEFPDGFDPDADYKESLADYTTGNTDITIPEGSIFVSGDNRTPGGSLDSRNELGAVSVDNIIGTLSVRIFPLSNAKFF